MAPASFANRIRAGISPLCVCAASPKEPIVEPMAVTTFGELGPGCTLVQEWLAMRLKAHLLAQPARPDGRDPAKITGRFRADFRLAIMMVCARRGSGHAAGSGLPDASIRGLRLPLPSARDSDGS